MGYNIQMDEVKWRAFDADLPTEVISEHSGNLRRMLVKFAESLQNERDLENRALRRLLAAAAPQRDGHEPIDFEHDDAAELARKMAEASKMSDRSRDCEHGQLARQCRFCELERANVGLAEEAERLKTALRFYGRGLHILDPDLELDESEQGWLDALNCSFTVENGGIARAALLNKRIDWEDEVPPELPEELASWGAMET